MKILRILLLAILFVLAVFICSANTNTVPLVLWPSVDMGGMPGEFRIDPPLFIVILGALLVGLLIGGTGAIFQQSRLKFGLRRANKEVGRLLASLAEAEQAVENERAAAESERASVESERAAMEQLREEVKQEREERQAAELRAKAARDEADAHSAAVVADDDASDNGADDDREPSS